MIDIKFKSSLCLLFFVNVAHGWFENCNKTYTIQPSIEQNIYSKLYPFWRYAEGSSCLYKFQTLPGYTIEARCWLELDDTDNKCATQRFFVSRDSDKQLRDAEHFCGTKNITRQSIGNEMTLAYTSKVGGAGKFLCTLKPILTTQDNCDCGWNQNTKIVNGVNATVNEFVSMVGFVDLTFNMVFCGGAIISQKYIITAAHCFVAYPIVSNILVLAGDHDTSTGNDTKYSSTYRIEKYFKHEMYVQGSSNQNNDIALAKTSEYMRFNRGVGPVCLPYAYMDDIHFFEHKTLVVAGWGALEYSGQSPSTLQKTSLEVMPSDICNQKIGDINDGKICTWSFEKDACQRDSGATLFYIGARRYTIGLVSYGTACATSHPSVNTRVSNYIDWIETTTNHTFYCRK